MNSGLMKTILIAILLSFGKMVLACTCEIPSVTDATETADLILIGKVIGSEEFVPDSKLSVDSITGEYEILWGERGYLVEIVEVFKGTTTKKNIWIRQSASPCGSSLKKGDTFLIFSRNTEKVKSSSSNNISKYYTSPCYRTKIEGHHEFETDLTYLKNTVPKTK
jgi:hypothetical protein